MANTENPQPIGREQIEEIRRLWRFLCHASEAADMRRDSHVLRELAPVAIDVIGLVATQPDIILREISDELSLPKTTLTSLIDRLEQRGFLHRTISTRDRRSYGLALTELGLSAYHEQQAFESHLCERILGAFPVDEERAEFLRLLKKATDSLLDSTRR